MIIKLLLYRFDTVGDDSSVYDSVADELVEGARACCEVAALSWKGSLTEAFWA